MRGDDVNYKTLYNEFLTGEGPEYSGFGANHPMTNDLKNSWIVGIATAKFLSINAENVKNNRPLQPLRMFDVPFGLVGAGMSGTNMTEQFIGGARISIIPTGSSLCILSITQPERTLIIYIQLPIYREHQEPLLLKGLFTKDLCGLPLNY
jgi:hypothetical protein